MDFYVFDSNFSYVGPVTMANNAEEALAEAKATYPKASGLMVQPKTARLNPHQLESMYQLRSGFSARSEMPPINLNNMPTPRRTK